MTAEFVRLVRAADAEDIKFLLLQKLSSGQSRDDVLNAFTTEDFEDLSEDEDEYEILKDRITPPEDLEKLQFLFFPLLRGLAYRSGYLRVGTAIAFLYFAFSNFTLACVLYTVSQLADAIDGVAARAFNQCSRFGQVLDMLTDRMTTLGLCVVLSHLYSDYWLVFTGLIILDIVSHWMQMFSTMLVGSTTHKTAQNFLLRFYYTGEFGDLFKFPYALLMFCCGNEGFFICCYLISFTGGWELSPFVLPAYACLPICACKNFFNILQLMEAADTIATFDLKERAAASKGKGKRRE